MNSLLARLAVLADQSGPAHGEEGQRALRLLDWPRVVDQIAAFCHNTEAADLIRRRQPCGDYSALELHWQLADELRPAGEAGRWPPLLEVTHGLQLLLRSRTSQYSGQDLVHLAGLGEGLDALREYFLISRNNFPTWGQAAVELTTFATMTTEIRRCLDRDGQVVDSASTTLARLRKACSGQERTVRQSVAAAMREAARRDLTTGPEVTLRGDRFCLPIRAGMRRKVDGIVHARSASGSTLFVEPAAVVHLHNELVELRIEVTGEEQRILHQLNQQVNQLRGALQDACRFLLLVDEIKAGLLWSKQYQAHRPRLAPGASLRICKGRHPLLLQYGPGGLAVSPSGVAAGEGVNRLEDRGDPPVVPLDLEVPADKRVILLSGPNAGGKSVALKTVGVCVLLAQCGWDIPAREDSQLPLIQHLFVDLGDEQSIEMSLSSFSAHLGHLVSFLTRADADSLVLCDEIGSGTDPQEGTALAFTVLDGLAERGACVLASTHLGLLKAAVHDHPAMINAAMDYDEHSLQPLFTFRLGVPGSSHAFDIAERWGFPSELLATARDLVGEERFQIERLLNELGQRARKLAEMERKLQAELATQAELEHKLSIKRTELERVRSTLEEDTRQQGDELLREGRRAIEGAVRKIRSGGADSQVIKEAREALDALGKRLPSPPASGAPPSDLQPGQLIQVPHLGLQGRIVEVRGDKVVTLAGGMRLILDRKSLDDGSVPLDQITPMEGVTREASWRWHDQPPEVQHEIDVRGLRSEDAWHQVDRLIDRAIPAGLQEILVIHGHGTGRLRDYLHECMTGDPRLRSHRPADPRRGGHGVTVVVLADD